MLLRTEPLESQVAALISSHPEQPLIPITQKNVAAMVETATVQRFTSPSGDHPVIVWHPTKPLLLTLYDIALWAIDGIPIHQFGSLGFGGWYNNGSHFAVQDKLPAYRIDAYDPLRQQIDYLESSASLMMYPNPSRPLIGLTDTSQIHGWIPHDRTIMTFDSVPHPMSQYLQWSPDGNWLLMLARSRYTPEYRLTEGAFLSMWNAEGHLLWHQHLNILDVSRPQWSPDSQHFVTRQMNIVQWWDRDGTIVNEYHLPSTPNMNHETLYHDSKSILAWSPTGRYLAVPSATAVYLFMADGELIGELFAGNESGIMCLAWHPTSPLITIGYWDGIIRLWSLEGICLHSIPAYSQGSKSLGTPYMLRWRTDGSYLAAALRNYSVHLYGLADQDD